jgi:hypothetical protein
MNFSCYNKLQHHRAFVPVCDCYSIKWTSTHKAHFFDKQKYININMIRNTLDICNNTMLEVHLAPKCHFGTIDNPFRLLSTLSFL